MSKVPLKDKSRNPLLSLESDSELTNQRNSRMKRISKERKEKPQRELFFTREHIGKINYSRQNMNNGVNKKKVLNINDPKPEQKKHQKSPHKTDTSVRPKVKVSDDSKIKLKALGFPTDGSVMVCFLCGRVKSQYARDCRIYEGEVCSEVKCKHCGFYHNSSKCNKTSSFWRRYSQIAFLRNYQPAICYFNKFENITKYEAKPKAESWEWSCPYSRTAHLDVYSADIWQNSIALKSVNISWFLSSTPVVVVKRAPSFSCS